MKKIYLGFLTTFLLTFFMVSQVHAAPLEGFISDCFSVAASGHTATLTIKPDGQVKPNPASKTWILVCITSGSDTKCTTGKKEVDEELFGKSDDYIALKAKATQLGGVDGGENPKMTNDDGTAFTHEPTKWSDEYHPAVVHQWSWLQEDIATGGGGVETGEAGAQQQGTFDFDKLKGDTSKCAKIGWDPRGYVFDAKTLNPVKGVMVTLSKGPKGGTFVDVPSGLGVTNPDRTQATNGQFSFYVEPGFYKLRLASTTPATMAKLTEINAAYRDLFLSSKGTTNIYQAGNEVEEVAGSVAIAHIPVNVTNQTALITNLNVLEKVADSVGEKINIFGRVSHPKSKIILTMSMLTEDGTTKDLVKTDVTDDLGEYDKYIDQTMDDTDGKKLILQSLNVGFELNSFYTTGIFSNNVFTKNTLGFIDRIINLIQSKLAVNAATSTSYVVKPIPTYIEGIAYDASGVAIPKAIVGVYPFFSENPMYVTIADETGRYKIGSQHLPRTEYKLRYKKPTGEVITVDTGTFIKQNVKFFAEEGILPFASKKTSVAEDTATKAIVEQTITETDLKAMSSGGSSGTSKPSAGGGAGNSANNLTPIKSSPVGFTGASQGILMVVVAILVLLLIGVGAFIMMRSKQQQPPQMM